MKSSAKCYTSELKANGPHGLDLTGNVPDVVGTSDNYADHSSQTRTWVFFFHALRTFLQTYRAALLAFRKMSNI